MSSSKLIHWSGLVAVLAGVLSLLSELLRLTIDFSNLSTAATTVTYAVDSVLGLLSMVLLQLALVGLYARQLEAAGVLGLIGFLSAFIGTGFSLGFAFVQAFVLPMVATEAPSLLESGVVVSGLGSILALVFFIIGWALFGMATFRAGIYPREASVLLVIGAVLLLAPLHLINIVFALSVAWLGYNLFQERSKEAPQPASVD